MADEEKAPEVPPEEKPFTKEVPIRYYGMEDVTGVYADQASVQHIGETFTLYFFQEQHPLTDDISVLQKVEELPTKCVSRVVLSPALMQNLFTAIEKNMAKYHRRAAYRQSHPEGKV